MDQPSRLAAYCTVALLALTACNGGLAQGLNGGIGNGLDVGGVNTNGLPGANSGTASGPTVASDHLPPASPCTSNAPAPRALRRLTQLQLNNTVSDLFGNNVSVPQTTLVFNADAETYGFRDITSNLLIINNTAAAMQSYAEAVAAFAAANPSLVSSCTTTDDTCRQSFISSFGKKVFRAPLNSTQVQAYDTLMASMPDFASGVQAVVSALMQSPYFLYRTELGTAGANGTYTLTQYEIASELSYMITNSMPDATLMAAADAGSLTTSAQIMAQAQRLMQTPRAHQAVDEFFMEWLQVADLNRDARQEGTTALSQTTSSEMQTETQMLVDDQVFTKGGTYNSLMTANYTFVNADLAGFYQMSGANSGSTFVQVPVSNGQRDAGVLGQGGVIAAASQATYASPTLRGRMVRMRLLCDSLGSPPPGVPALDDSNPNQTLRQRFTAHVSNQSCAVCHDLMDPLGFTLGDYDTLGRLRPADLENGQLVDASGSLYVAPGDSGSQQSLSGLSQLITDLSSSPQAEGCLSRHMAMYAFGSVSWNQDSCTYTSAASGAAAANYNLQSAWLAITQTPSFTQRVQDP